MPFVKGPDDSKEMVAFQSSAIVAKFRTETAHLFPYFFALFPLILPLCRYRLNLPALSISILELYVIFVIFGGVIVLHQLQYSVAGMQPAAGGARSTCFDLVRSTQD